VVRSVTLGRKSPPERKIGAILAMLVSVGLNEVVKRGTRRSGDQLRWKQSYLHHMQASCPKTDALSS
jgi:hypothetical protein